MEKALWTYSTDHLVLFEASSAVVISNAGDGQKESQAGAAVSGVWDCKKDAAPRARSPVQAFSRC